MKDIYTALVSNVFFPLHEAMKGHDTVSVRKSMEDSQWRSAAELEDVRLARLRQLLANVSQHVPYYRELFDRSGFDGNAVDSLSDLRKLPFLTKEIIRKHTEGLKADNAKGLQRFNTGGSSGEPLIFYIDKQRVSHDVAAKWRATRWWGVDIGDPEIVIWGSPIELGAQDRVRQVRDKMLRTRLLPAFDMSAERLDQFVAEIRRVRPKMLFGYPSALSLIATHAETRGVQMDDLGIKVAFVTSERLYEHQRNKIQTVFGCPVANGYGSRDAGFIAHECPEGGMHITAEDVIVEIVGTDGEVLPFGESGEIVVTHLATSGFPFIRYRTGDVGVLTEERCACGRGLPLLKEIQGRTTDFVVAADGTVLHGLALIYVLRDLTGVREFKITQESLAQTRVEIVKGDGYEQSAESLIRQEFGKRLGSEVEILIEYADSISSEKSGKFRYVVSKVDVPQ